MPTTDLLLDRGMMGDGVIDLRAIRAMVEAAGYRGHCEVEILSAQQLVEARPRRGAARLHRAPPDRRVIMTTTYDGIILGAGHNGLILQAYLGKAGTEDARDRAHGRSPAAA